MNDSFVSAEESQTKTKNILYNQIQTQNTTHWQPDELEFNFNRSQSESFNQSRENVSFEADLPIQSKITEPNFEVDQLFDPISCEPEKEQPVKVELKSQEPSCSLSSQSSIPSQITITLHQQSITSKIYEEIDTRDVSNFSSSLISFLTMNDKNYKPHVKCLKFLFGKLKQYSQRSLQNLKNYINFMEVKLRQQIESLRFLDSLQSIDNRCDDTQELDIDEKVIMERIKSQNIARRQKRKCFYKSIKDYYESLLQCWRKIKQRRQKRERFIDEEIILVIDRIQLEMEDMIICRLQNEKEHIDGKYTSQKLRSHNPYLSKDKYLQMKYLMQRENAYLKLITDFNGKLITYLVTMFSIEEIQISKTIKQALIDYASSYMECYDTHNEILNLKIDDLDDSQCQENAKNQLTEQLLTMIPIQLYNISERTRDIHFQQNDKLQALLGDFSKSLQNTIFLSTIEMNNDFILFSSQALWKTTNSQLQKQENSILYESRGDSKLQSKQALGSSRPSLNMGQKVQKNIKIIVVLTSNYYLHLEYDDKIATLRLGDIKLSKRGREIVIYTKQNGLGSYFGLKKQLGVLEFQNMGEVQLFAQKLSKALSKLT